MPKKVLLTITPKGGAPYKIEGRLIGAGVTEEVTKLVQNISISSKAHTMETKRLEDVIEYLTKLEADNQTTAVNMRTHGHLVATLDAIKADSDATHHEVISRQLYITPPIKLTPEHTINTAKVSVNFECTDGTLITVAEYEVKGKTYGK